MEFMNRLFLNTFFDLPFLEALTYLGIVMLLGAAIVGLWDRLVKGPAVSARQEESYHELPKAA